MSFELWEGGGEEEGGGGGGGAGVATDSEVEVEVAVEADPSGSGSAPPDRTLTSAAGGVAEQLPASKQVGEVLVAEFKTRSTTRILINTYCRRDLRAAPGLPLPHAQRPLPQRRLPDGRGADGRLVGR